VWGLLRASVLLASLSGVRWQQQEATFLGEAVRALLPQAWERRNGTSRNHPPRENLDPVSVVTQKLVSRPWNQELNQVIRASVLQMGLPA